MRKSLRVNDIKENNKRNYVLQQLLRFLVDIRFLLIIIIMAAILYFILRFFLI
jgi:hypothetical protein